MYICSHIYIFIKIKQCTSILTDTPRILHGSIDRAHFKPEIVNGTRQHGSRNEKQGNIKDIHAAMILLTRGESIWLQAIDYILNDTYRCI